MVMPGKKTQLMKYYIKYKGDPFRKLFGFRHKRAFLFLLTMSDNVLVTIKDKGALTLGQRQRMCTVNRVLHQRCEIADRGTKRVSQASTSANESASFALLPLLRARA